MVTIFMGRNVVFPLDPGRGSIYVMKCVLMASKISLDPGENSGPPRIVVLVCIIDDGNYDTKNELVAHVSWLAP